MTHTHSHAPNVEGDVNELAVKALPAFNRSELESIPVGSHVIFGSWDAEAVHPQFEGFEWNDEARDAQFTGMSQIGDDGTDLDMRYAAIALYVPPMTDNEASQIADTVLSDYAENLYPEEAVEFRRNAQQWRHLIEEAAKKGRGAS